MMLVLFGLPGAGKTYTGQLFARKYGWYFYDGDQDLPQRMLDALETLSQITDEMRDEFFHKLLQNVKNIQKKHENIVVSQTFIKEKYREWMLRNFPDAQFILIQSDTSVREKRLYDRRKSEAYLAYARVMVTYFEEPKINYLTIENSEKGEKSLNKQLKEIALPRSNPSR